MFLIIRYNHIIFTIDIGVLQLREFKRDRKLSNDKIEAENEELRKIKKVRLYFIFMERLQVIIISSVISVWGAIRELPFLYVGDVIDIRYFRATWVLSSIRTIIKQLSFAKVRLLCCQNSLTSILVELLLL